MPDAPQTLDSKPYPETESIQDPSLRVPRKIVEEDAGQSGSIFTSMLAPADTAIPSVTNIPFLSGISFPPNMDPSIILSSDRALSLLKQLDSRQIQATVDEFAEAMNNKGTKIRSIQAYFIGVCKKYVSASHKDDPSHSNGSTKGKIMGGELSPAVKVRPKASNALHILLSSIAFTHLCLNRYASFSESYR